MAASLLGGITLGGYTAGGFNEREPTDVIAQTASRARGGSFRAESVAPQAPTNHVCRGCDAKLNREDSWYGTEAGYDENEEGMREEEESRDAIRTTRTDRPRARERDDTITTVDNFDINQYVVDQPGASLATLDE